MLTIYVNATQRYFRAQKEVVVKYPYSYDNLKSSSSLKSMKRGRIQGELLKSARDAVQCLMDDQTGVMISKELQEIHRTTSNEMMRRTDISVRLVLDANSEVDSVLSGGRLCLEKMTLLDNDHFLTELSKLFQKARVGGPQAVTITLKHYDGRTKPHPKNVDPSQLLKGEDLCLFRAKLGDKKISTVVHPKEVNKFQLAYAAVLKTNIDSLKKRERKPAGGDVKPKRSAPKKAVKV